MDEVVVLHSDFAPLLPRPLHVMLCHVVSFHAIQYNPIRCQVWYCRASLHQAGMIAKQNLEAKKKLEAMLLRQEREKVMGIDFDDNITLYSTDMLLNIWTSYAGKIGYL